MAGSLRLILPVLYAVLLSCHCTNVLPIIKGYFEKMEITSGECLDEYSQARQHLDVWNYTVGSCDKVICFHGSLKKYYINNMCRRIEDVEIPDLENCERVQDLTLAYPDCCHELRCATGSYPTTASGPVCADVHSAENCQRWNEIGACNPSNALYQNFTLNIYCAKTCGICS